MLIIALSMSYFAPFSPGPPPLGAGRSRRQDSSAGESSAHTDTYCAPFALLSGHDGYGRRQLPPRTLQQRR